MEGQPWPTGNRAHAELLSAIGRALGLAGPLPEWRAGAWTGEPDPSDLPPLRGRPFQVMGGWADPENDRVAWIEEHCFGPYTAEDDMAEMAELVIHLAGSGVRHLPPLPQPGWILRPGSPWVSLPLVEGRGGRLAEIHSLELSGNAVVATYDFGFGELWCRYTIGTSDQGEAQVRVDEGVAGSDAPTRSWPLCDRLR